MKTFEDIIEQAEIVKAKGINLVECGCLTSYTIKQFRAMCSKLNYFRRPANNVNYKIIY